MFKSNLQKKRENFHQRKNRQAMIIIFSRNINEKNKTCAPQKIIFLSHDKPKVNLQNNSFKSQILNSKETELEKWNIFNDTNTPKKYPTFSFCHKFFFVDIIKNSCKIAKFPNHNLSTLGCFYKKDTKSCLTDETHQNKPKNSTPFLSSLQLP